MYHPLLPMDVQEQYQQEGLWAGVTLAEDVARHAAARPQHAALLGEHPMSYAELDRAAASAAGAMRDMGLGHGDRVVACLPADWTAVVVVVACSRIGVTLAPIWVSASAAQVLGTATALRAKLVILAAAHADRVDWHATFPLLRDSVAEVRIASAAPGTDIQGWAAPLEAMFSHRVPETDFRGDPSVPALVLSTGGTTGEPKLVLQTENATRYAGREFARIAGINEDSVYAMSGPLGHALTNVFGITQTLSVGASLLPLPRWEPLSCAEAIRQHGAQFTMLSATHVFDWVQLDGDPRQYFSTMRGVYAGGKPDEHYPEFQRRTGVPVFRTFGMSEAPGNLVTRREDSEVERATEGRPYDGFEHHVVDPAGSLCAPGFSGELQVRGPSLFHGYFQRDDLTQAAVTEQGFYRSGDLFVRTESGCYSIIGRITDIIRRGHVSVDPSEAEALLVGHPGIAEACVVGVPDERLGERVAAAIVPVVPEPPTLAELTSYLLARGLPKLALPERLVVTDSIPRTSVGKQDKRSAREAVIAHLQSISDGVAETEAVPGLEASVPNGGAR